MIFSGWAAWRQLQDIQDQEEKEKLEKAKWICDDGENKFKHHKWGKHKCNCELCYVEKICIRCGQED